MPSAPATVSIRPAVPGRDDPAVAGLFADYLGWAADQLLQEYGVDLRPTDPDQIRASVAALQDDRGRLLLAEQNGEPVGVGALRTIGPGVGEVKRMYVRPVARGAGAGGLMLDALLAAAAELELSTLRLDTCRFMTDAHRLYRSRQFQERPPYPESEIPPELHQYWIFFERRDAGWANAGAQR